MGWDLIHVGACLVGGCLFGPSRWGLVGVVDGKLDMVQLLS